MDNPVLRLERRDPAKRMLRFYTLQVLPNLFGEWGLLRGWGRIGRGGQLRVDWFTTQQEAVKAMQVLEQEKRKRGYTGKNDKAASDLMIRAPKAAGCSCAGTAPSGRGSRRHAHINRLATQ